MIKTIVDEDGTKLGTWDRNLIYDLDGHVAGYANSSSRLSEYRVHACLYPSFHGETTGDLITIPGSEFSTLSD